jgi:hypothetical protein
MIRRLVEEGGVRGVHFCTLNLEKSVRSILETLGWAPGHAKIHTRLIAVSSFVIVCWSPRFMNRQGVCWASRTTHNY